MIRLTAAVTALLALAAPAFAGPPELRTPSGNIGCVHEPDAADRLLCIRLKPTELSIILTRDGADYGPSEYEGEVWFPKHAPVLAYGKSRRLGPYLCRSETTGLTCRIGKTGFTVNKAGVRAF